MRSGGLASFRRTRTCSCRWKRLFAGQSAFLWPTVWTYGKTKTWAAAICLARWSSYAAGHPRGFGRCGTAGVSMILLSWKNLRPPKDVLCALPFATGAGLSSSFGLAMAGLCRRCGGTTAWDCWRTCTSFGTRATAPFTCIATANSSGSYGPAPFLRRRWSPAPRRGYGKRASPSGRATARAVKGLNIMHMRSKSAQQAPDAFSKASKGAAEYRSPHWRNARE